MDLDSRLSGNLSADNSDRLDDNFMNRCPKATAKLCSYLDDSLLDHLHLDDNKALSSTLEKHPDLLLARDKKGQTLLHIAAARNRYRCVDALLQLGADGFAVDNESGWTPLHAALYRGSLLAAKILLQQKASPISVMDNEGNTPFDLIPAPKKSELEFAGTRHVLISFGSGGNFQLGVVSDSLARNRPKSLDALLNEDIVDFDVCEIGGAAVSASGLAFSWGVNKDGRLGVGDDASRVRPHPVPLPLFSDKRCISVSTCLTHSVFLLSTGEVYTCGKGYLGHDPVGKVQQQSLTPRKVEKGLKRVIVVGISCSKFRTCLVTEFGDALLLGYHMEDEAIDYIPTKIEGLSHIRVVRMVTTNGHWIAQSADGDLYEQTRRERRFFRVPISRISKKDTNRPAVVNFSSCKTHSVAVTSDGTLWSWPSRAVKGCTPALSSRPLPPRPVKAVRNDVVITASTSIDHSTAITSNGLIEWEHDAPRIPPAGHRIPDDWLPTRIEKATRLPYPRQVDKVVCAPGCTLVSQQLLLVDERCNQIENSTHRIPTLLRLCENAFCKTTDERRSMAAFRFAFNIHLQHFLDHCSSFIVNNRQVLLFNALRDLEISELDYLEGLYQQALPSSVTQYSRNEKPPSSYSVDDTLDLEWFVPHTIRHLRARIRSCLKKLSQIAVLSDRIANGEKLNPEQLQKVKLKDRLRLFLQQCQGELACKLEPDPIIEIHQQPTNSSESQEVVTIVRPISRHCIEDWRAELPSSETESSIASLFKQQEVVALQSSDTELSRPKVSTPLLSPIQSISKVSLRTSTFNSSQDLRPARSVGNPTKSALSAALPISLVANEKAIQSQLRRVSVAQPSVSDSASRYTSNESTGTSKPNTSEGDSTSVRLADFWTNTRSSPINIKSRSKSHPSKTNQQNMSPGWTGSPWNTVGMLRAKPFAEIQNEDAAKTRNLSEKRAKNADTARNPGVPDKCTKVYRSPWAAHSPTISSFANIVQEEMAMSLQFSDQTASQPRTCWGPRASPVKPTSIESIQSLQFIQEEMDREAHEQARAMQDSSQKRRGLRYRRKVDPQLQYKSSAAAVESRHQEVIARSSARPQ